MDNKQSGPAAPAEAGHPDSRPAAPAEAGRPDSKPAAPAEAGHPDSRPESFWRLAVEATTLGWNLVIPIVGGVLLGRYLDDLFDEEFTWTLSLLLMGVAVAFNNLYTMYIEHSDTEPLRERIRKRYQRKREESEKHEENT